MVRKTRAWHWLGLLGSGAIILGLFLFWQKANARASLRSQGLERLEWLRQEELRERQDARLAVYSLGGRPDMTLMRKQQDEIGRKYIELRARCRKEHGLPD